MKRFATSELNEGICIMTTGSLALNKMQCSHKTRYKEDVSNETSPEELIAAAHADCYTSMFKIIFEKAKFEIQYLRTRVEVSVDMATNEVTRSHIFVTAKIPNISKEQFIKLAILAKDTCPISKLLKADIMLDCELID